MATCTPERSMAQRREALEHANVIRLRRAGLKRELRAGHADAASLLVDPPDWLLSMRAFDLLLAVPKFGRVKTNRMFSRACISPSKTIVGLSPRQRAVLADALTGARRR